MKRNFNFTELVKWLSIFDVLSMERCFQFFERMGLPKSIIGQPTKLLSIIRNFEAQAYTGLYKEGMTKAEYERTFEDQMEIIFNSVAEQYDMQTADKLYFWATTYSIDSNKINWLEMWNYLFNQLNVLFEHNSNKLVSLEVNIIKVVSESIRLRFEKFDAQVLFRDTRIASLPPFTKWENELILYHIKESDDYNDFNVIELIMDTIISACRMHNTFMVWKRITELLDKNGLLSLLIWGHAKTLADGLPDYPFMEENLILLNSIIGSE